MAIYLGSNQVDLKGASPGSERGNALVFIDYDGTKVASYSLLDAIALNALPANPSHAGLTAQGWNWTLPQIKDYLTDYPKATVNVGQMYITNDGKTRIYVHFEKGRSSPYFGIGVNGTVIIDWGDDSSTNTLTGTSLTTVKTIQHVYTPGDYIITLTVNNGSFSFFGESNAAHIMKKGTETTMNVSNVYASAVQKIELGTGAKIGDRAFYNCSSLVSITIPNTVTDIGTNTFQNCYSLTSITIPNTITSISNYAFYNCYSLTSITIPGNVTNIGIYAFSGCRSLTSITIPNTITSIGNNTFYTCSSLANIIIPSGVTSISNNAFQNCYFLSSIIIPNTVTSIGTYAFNSCCSLTNITIPSGVTSIKDYAFQNCYSLANIIIPSGITSIKSYAFQNCYSLTSIIIPNTVTSIGNYAFYNCSSLTSIIISNTITSISTNTFSSCFSLASITIPSGITNIGTYAFLNCYGVAEYHFLPTTPPTLANINAFNNIQSDCVIYVPAESLEAYQTAENWSTYASYMVGE